MIPKVDKNLVYRDILICLLVSLVSADSLHCPTNMFMNGHGICQELLSCENMLDIKVQQELQAGYVKQLYVGLYNGLKVVYSVSRYANVTDDFLHGILMLRTFQQSKYVVELIGYCEKKEHLALVTRYHKYGSANSLNALLESLNLTYEETSEIRFIMSMDYLKILNFLHNSPVGVRVMCDSNDLMKTLSQYLITNDFHLVVADLDALPRVNRSQNKTVKCGHRQLFGEFVAPEQLWPYEDRSFDDSEMPGYDEKIDIWRVPDVLMYLLGNHSHGTQMILRMINMLSRCKDTNPFNRPTAFELHEELMKARVAQTYKVEL